MDLRSRENNRAHRTEEIDGKRLIVRRGQAFSLAVHLSDPLQAGHELALVLKQGKQLKASTHRLFIDIIELPELKSLTSHCSVPLIFSNIYLTNCSKGLHNLNNLSCSHV